MSEVVKERPILFSAAMVRALLDGRKTQTRRVVKPQPVGGLPHDNVPVGSRCYVAGPTSGLYPYLGTPICTRTSEAGYETVICPYGQPGDRLWVRESFNWSTDELLLPGEPHHHCPERAVWAAQNVVWRADGSRTHPEYGKALWLPSIHMPRWASRILLEITNVRVERAREITEDDVHAEGCDIMTNGHEHAQEWFRNLWDSINAKRGFGWDVNPWVWVIEFRRIA